MNTVFKSNIKTEKISNFLSNLAVPFIVIDEKDLIIETNSAAINMFQTIYINEDIDILNININKILWFIQEEFSQFKLNKDTANLFYKEAKFNSIVWTFSGKFSFIEGKITLILNYHIKKDECIKTSVLMDSILDSSEEVIVWVNLDGTILSWNKAAEKIYGYSKKEILGKNISLIDSRKDTKNISYILDKIKAEEKITNYEVKRISKNKSEIFLSINVSPIKDYNKKIIGACAIERDITSIKNTTKKFQNFTNLSSDIFCILDFSGNFLEISPGIRKILGWSEKEFVNKNLKKFIHPDDIPGATTSLHTLLKFKNDVVKNRYIAKDGKYKWIE